MDRHQLSREALHLIEEAKKLSKERFLIFTENMYGTQRNSWDQLWETPIVSNYDIADCFPEELTSLLEEYAPDFWDSFSDKQLENTEAVFLPIEKIIAEASLVMDDETYESFLQEYNARINDDRIPQGQFMAIIYDEEHFIKTYVENIRKASSKTPPMTKEQVANSFTNYVSKIFTHERIHQNTRAIVPDPSNENPNGIDYVYGVRLQNNYESSDPSKAEFEGLKLLAFEDHDEEFVDTVAQIIEQYSPGDTIENCLCQIFGNTDKSLYRKIESKLVLSLFTLFPDELTRWAIFETKDSNHHNLFLEKHDEVFGSNMTTKPSKLRGETVAPYFMTDKYILDAANTYFRDTLAQSMNPKQAERYREMLEMLGVDEEHSLDDDVAAIMAIIFSNDAMEQLPQATQDIKAAKKSLETTKSEPKKQKNDIEP